MKYIPSILAFVILSLGGGVLTAYAQGYTPLAPLPGTVDESTGTSDLPTYVGGAIKLLIALGAALAVLYAIIGGTQYVAAGISPDAKSGAKERIFNSLIGLTIILSSYLILNSINPDLVTFKLTLPSVTVRNLTPVSTPGVGGNGNMPAAEPGSLCPITAPNLALLDDSAASSMEAGNNVVWFSDDPGINSNLQRLKGEVTKLQLALPQLNSSWAVNVTSAYRPYNYQLHLYQLYKAWKLDGLETNIDPECAELKISVGSDYQMHGLGSLVANPDSQSSPHMSGTGVDLSPVNVNFGNFSAHGYTDINAFMVHEGIDLRWQNITGDQWHFNLQY